MTAEQAVLGPGDVGRYLAARGLLAPAPEVVELAGGVSCATYLAAAAGRRVVVKQALGQLRTAREWFVPRDRVLAEADALRLAATLTPDAVPAVLHVDEAALLLVMEAAPQGWSDWKRRLLAGEVAAGLGTRLGTVLARWHGATGDRPLPERLEGFGRMDGLRLAPFHATVGARRPDLAPALAALIEQLHTPVCLVHGDFSPKNVLTGGGALWVIDFEVAHRGAPVFDLAFLLSHLTLKALHLPGSAAALRRLAEAFLLAYREGGGLAAALAEPALSRHTGALVLSRLLGTSPVDYAEDRWRADAIATGERLLRAPAGPVLDLALPAP
jgi:aminoglycoside phosphotransferase (APT) family kinase protein